MCVGTELIHGCAGISELQTQQKDLKEQLSCAERRIQRSKKANAAAAEDVKAAEQTLHEAERQAWPSYLPCCIMMSSHRSKCLGCTLLRLSERAAQVLSLPAYKFQEARAAWHRAC